MGAKEDYAVKIRQESALLHVFRDIREVQVAVASLGKRIGDAWQIYDLYTSLPDSLTDDVQRDFERTWDRVDDASRKVEELTKAPLLDAIDVVDGYDAWADAIRSALSSIPICVGPLLESEGEVKDADRAGVKAGHGADLLACQGEELAVGLFGWEGARWFRVAVESRLPEEVLGMSGLFKSPKEVEPGEVMAILGPVRERAKKAMLALLDGPVGDLTPLQQDIAKAQEAQDAWMYETRKGEVTYTGIITNMKKSPRPHWKPIKDDSGVKRGIIRHIERHGLTDLPPGKPGRPRGS